jgi:hypothetical protein
VSRINGGGKIEDYLTIHNRHKAAKDDQPLASLLADTVPRAARRPKTSSAAGTSPACDSVEVHVGVGSISQPDIWTGSITIEDHEVANLSQHTNSPKNATSALADAEHVQSQETWTSTASPDVSPSAARSKSKVRSSKLASNSSPSPLFPTSKARSVKSLKASCDGDGSETEPESDEEIGLLHSHHSLSLIVKASSSPPQRKSPRLSHQTPRTTQVSKEREASPCRRPEDATFTQDLHGYATQGAALSIPADYGIEPGSSQTMSSMSSDGSATSIIRDFMDMFDSQERSFPPDFPESLK